MLRLFIQSVHSSSWNLLDIQQIVYLRCVDMRVCMWVTSTFAHTQYTVVHGLHTGAPLVMGNMKASLGVDATQSGAKACLSIEQCAMRGGLIKSTRNVLLWLSILKQDLGNCHLHVSEHSSHLFFFSWHNKTNFCSLCRRKGHFRPHLILSYGRPEYTAGKD